MRPPFPVILSHLPRLSTLWRSNYNKPAIPVQTSKQNSCGANLARLSVHPYPVTCYQWQNIFIDFREIACKCSFIRSRWSPSFVKINTVTVTIVGANDFVPYFLHFLYDFGENPYGIFPNNVSKHCECHENLSVGSRTWFTVVYCSCFCYLHSPWDMYNIRYTRWAQNYCWEVWWKSA